MDEWRTASTTAVHGSSSSNSLWIEFYHFGPAEAHYGTTALRTQNESTYSFIRLCVKRCIYCTRRIPKIQIRAILFIVLSWPRSTISKIMYATERWTVCNWMQLFCSKSSRIVLRIQTIYYWFDYLLFLRFFHIEYYIIELHRFN